MAATSAVAGLVGRRREAVRRTAGLTRELAWTQFKLKYTGSVLGYLWSLLKPMMLFGVMYAIFVGVFKQTQQDFGMQLLVGIVMYTFFTDCVGAGMGSIAANGNLIRKAFFHRAVLVVASSLTAAMTFVINLTLIIVIATPLGLLHVGLRTLAVLPLIAEVYAVALGLSLLLSALFVFYRDLGHIWEIFSQVLFYGSAVVYPASRVPVGWRGIVFLNPLAQIIEDVRHAMVIPDAPWSYSLIGIRFLAPVALCVLVLFGGTWVFRRLTPSFAEAL